MDTKRYKVRLNSVEKIEELLQEIYDQSCRQITEILTLAQNEINKLTNSTNLGSDDVTMEEKAKYAKAVHDFTVDKIKAIGAKFEIAKFMGEILKNSGDINAVVNDKNYAKRTSLNLNDLKAAINDDGGDTDTYILKKN